jgi:cysteine-rich repeat protein
MRGLVVGVALMVCAATTALFAAGCSSSNTTTECSTGVVCAEGYICTLDGTGCISVDNSCGNGVVETGEECDDGNLVDTDDCTSTCTVAKCSDGFVDMTGSNLEECDPGNGVLETASCNSDCTLSACGDGVQNSVAGETCDNGRGGPSMGASGDSAECDRDCTIPACQDGVFNANANEQCDNGTDVSTDNCSPTCKIEECGNAVVDPGEACDDGNTNDVDGCRNNCLSDNTCGNHVVDDNLPNNRTNDPATCLNSTTQNTNCAEVCDDGNRVSGDGCSANCLSEETCRNGILDPIGNGPNVIPHNPAELCDDGNDIEDVPVGSHPEDICNNDCQGGAGCGNGNLEAPEQCDTGQLVDTATCDFNCTLPICGDNHVNTAAGEVCDPGSPGADTATCNSNCTLPVCGDNRVNIPAGELCDPGTVGADIATCNSDCTIARCGDSKLNLAANETCDTGGNSTTCDSDCSARVCGDGFVNSAASEQCDPGAVGAFTATCDSDCTNAFCGDGTINAVRNEACDPGAVGVSVAGCDLDCTAPSCGDGVINRAFHPPGAPVGVTETCDDNNTMNGDGCDSNCQSESCGNGVTEPANGEQCDDGDTNDANGCRNNCQLPRCDDGVFSSTETCDTGGNTVSCDVDCTAPMCGDGIVNLAANEQCEDGNSTNGDGCSSNCRVEPFTLTTLRTGDGGGSIGSTPSGISCGGDCSELFQAGTVVNLTASPDAQSTFNGWSGGGCLGIAPCTITMNQVRTLSADFAANRLTVTRDGTGLGQVTGTGIMCGGGNNDCTEIYNINTMVTLTATPDAQSSFAGWTGACTGLTSPCTVAMNQAKSVTATFNLQLFAMTTAIAGNGNGTVVSVPSGIACNSPTPGSGICSANFLANTVVTLVPAPAVDSTFTGWSGISCLGTGNCVVTMTAAKSVTATYTLRLFTLTVVSTGGGSVSSAPAGISNCSSTCMHDFNAGTMVTLTATPNSQRAFAGWSGGGCSGTGTCMVTVDAAQSVTATFVVNRLTIVRSGDGSGTVTASGISCGGDCTEDYNSGTGVTVTASASTSSRFTGWTLSNGATCPGTGTCMATMNGPVTLTANFVPTHVLTIQKSGSGQGTVTAAPDANGGSLSCNASCSSAAGTYDDGTVVVLTAVADGASVFTGWSGSGISCPGTGTCTVSMSAAHSVTANFN